MKTLMTLFLLLPMVACDSHNSNASMKKLRSKFCKSTDVISATCFSLSNLRHALLFTGSIYATLDTVTFKIVNFSKTTDMWPELTTATAVDAACSSTDGIQPKAQQYIFIRGFMVYFYSYNEHGQNQVVLADKGDIREYETLGLTRVQTNKVFSCGSCYNEFDAFYLTAFEKNTSMSYFCVYSKNLQTKTCEAINEFMAPYDVDPNVIKRDSDCQAIAFNSNNVSHVTTVFVDKQNVSIFYGNNLVFRNNIRDLFGCTKMSSSNLGTAKKVPIKKFPMVLLVIIAVMVIAILCFTVLNIYLYYKRRSEYIEEGHVMKIFKSGLGAKYKHVKPIPKPFTKPNTLKFRSALKIKV